MNYKRLHEIDAELQRMIDHPGNETIEDYVRLQRERSNLLLAAEAEAKMLDPREAARREAIIKEVCLNIQGRNI